MKKAFLLFLTSVSFLCADIVSFNCVYQMYASKEGLKKDKDFTMSFIIDTKTNKAYLKGNNGTSPVNYILGNERQITFIEQTTAGNITTTTIVDNESVHSRNMVIFGKLTPSQYYGTCKSN